MGEGQVVTGSLWVYAPNKVAPVVFALLFLASFVGHLWQCIHHQAFRLVGLHVVCAGLFTLGFILREVGAFHYLYNSTNLIFCILSQVFIYVCPPLLELSNYHVLGRIFSYMPKLAPLPASKISVVFGGLLLMIEGINGAGVSLAVNPTSSSTTHFVGKVMTILALVVQVIVILTCLVLAAVFHKRYYSADTKVGSITTPLVTLYISMALILVRSGYRLAEYSGETNVDIDDPEALSRLDPMLRYEWYFYVFEAATMFVNSVLWNIWHPARYLPRSANIQLLPDGVTEIELQDQYEPRSVLRQGASVLTFGLLFRRKRSKKAGADHGFEELTEHV